MKLLRNDNCESNKHFMIVNYNSAAVLRTIFQSVEIYNCRVFIRLASVVNRIKHFTIVIYDSRVIMTRQLPLLRLQGCSLRLLNVYNIGHRSNSQTYFGAGRMALLVTLFLVLVNIFNTVTTNTPKAEGLTAIEAWSAFTRLYDRNLRLQSRT